MVFIVYLVILLLFNPLTDSWKPSQITTTFNVSSILFMYLIGYHYIDSIAKLKKLYNILLINSVIIFVYFIVIQFFSFELVMLDQSYSDVFKTHHFDYDIYTVSFTFLFSFFFRWNLHRKGEKLINTFFLVSNFIILILFMKRWAIFCTVIGIVIYFYNSGNTIKKLKSFSIVVIILTLTSLFFMDLISEQFLNRGVKVTGISEIESEGRFLDYINIYHYLTTNQSVLKMLVGGNLFESRDFGMKYLHQIRNIHPDLVALLYGTGFIGLFLYIYIYRWMYKKMQKIYNRGVKTNLTKDLKALFNVFIFTLLFASIAGGALRVTTANSLAFLLLGACTKIIFNKYIETKHVVSIE